MRLHKVGGLPVVDGEGRLVGIITERDLMDLAGQLLEEAARRRVAGPWGPHMEWASEGPSHRRAVP